MTRFSVAALCICIGLWITTTGGRADSADSRGVALNRVLALLETSPTGRSLIQKATQAWQLKTRQELSSHLKWGDASRTDAVLIRHYDAETGKESRERRVTIYLRRDQSPSDLMLDLAHELVHATAKPTWDPYDPKLTAGSYIHATIEGEGGEVDAVRAECQVSLEVLGEKSESSSALRCRKYWSAQGAELIRSDFYRVGHWIGDLQRQLGSEKSLFPLLSDAKPALYSSTGGTPYPVALFEEYRQMTAVACENTRRRAPASASAPDEPQERSARLFLFHRCKN